MALREHRLHRSPPLAERPCAAWWAGVLLATAGAAAAAGPPSLPDDDEISAALMRVGPTAQAHGLTLERDPDWRATLAGRLPLASRLNGSRCSVRHSAWLPAQDWRWLFPPLPPAERTAWIDAAIHHELTHCAEQARRRPAPVDRTTAEGPPPPMATATARPSPLADDPAIRPTAAPAMSATFKAGWRSEQLADLAFARHLVTALPRASARRLVEHLAGLRQSRSRQDPMHDSSRALSCFLRWADGDGTGLPVPRPDAAVPADPWPALDALAARCIDTGP